MIHLHLLTRESILLSLINWHHCDLGIELCSIPARTLGTKMLSVEIFRMSRYNQQCHENHGLSVFVCTSYSCFVSVSDDDLSFMGAYSLMARDDARGLCKRPRYQSAGNTKFVFTSNHYHYLSPGNAAGCSHHSTGHPWACDSYSTTERQVPPF